MYFLHYYIQKGHRLQELLELGFEEKAFYLASMMQAIKESQIKEGE